MIIRNSAEAEDIVRAKFLAGSKHDFIIQTKQTQERDFGWVVFYTTRRFAETGNPSYLVPGVGPVAVMHDGEVVPLASSVPPAAAVTIFENEWRRATGLRDR